jgi:S-adenosylmethionine:tRNA ribosyltransferase-isomerase
MAKAKRSSSRTEGRNLGLSDFDYELPGELIAQAPLPRRDDSRMMVVDRRARTIRHEMFKGFPGWMGPGDLVVFNDTRVIPARVWGTTEGARVEFLFLGERGEGLWEVLCRPARRLRRGGRVRLAFGLEAVVEEVGPEGRRFLRFDGGDVRSGLRGSGFAPLPPYIKRGPGDSTRREMDLERYQTVFAVDEGAIAAPTAGLHFTPEVLEGLRSGEVRTAFVTLEVGLATFEPVRTESLADHRMLEEDYRISSAAARTINEAKADGRPLTAVGTTVVRALETASILVSGSPGVNAGKGRSGLFIRPGHEFRIVDRLLTNFHLPRSTLLVLVAAFAGRELVLEAYREAVREGYRFFSYGDCMLIL